MSTLEEIELMIKSELEEAQCLLEMSKHEKEELYHMGRVNELRQLLRMLEPLRVTKEY